MKHNPDQFELDLSESKKRKMKIVSFDKQTNTSHTDDVEKPILFERESCQYCGDGGLCTFCDRGRKAISEYLTEEKTKKKKRILS